MRQEVFEIVQKMDKDNIRTQMALKLSKCYWNCKKQLTDLIHPPGHSTEGSETNKPYLWSRSSESVIKR